MKKKKSRSIRLALSPDQCDYVAERAIAYGSTSKYVSELIRRDREVSADEALERELLAGLASGPMRTLDAGFFDALRARIRSAGTPKRSTSRRAGKSVRRTK